MALPETACHIDDHFAGKAGALRAVYDRLIAEVKAFGPIVEEPKKTSIHLVRRTAFAGVQVQKKAINLNIKAAALIDSPRIRTSEQISANRFHHLVRLETLADVDDELLGWLRAAYELST